MEELKERKFKKKIYILEGKWKSKKDFHTTFKWLKEDKEYNEEWKKANTYSSVQAAKNSLENHLKDFYQSDYYSAKIWRVRNKETQEIWNLSEIIE